MCSIFLFASSLSCCLSFLFFSSFLSFRPYFSLHPFELHLLQFFPLTTSLSCCYLLSIFSPFLPLTFFPSSLNLSFLPIFVFALHFLLAFPFLSLLFEALSFSLSLTYLLKLLSSLSATLCPSPLSSFQKLSMRGKEARLTQ